MFELKYKNTEKQVCDFSMHRATNAEDFQKAVKKRSLIMLIICLAAAVIYVFAAFKMKEQGKFALGLTFAGVFALFGILNLLFFGKFINMQLRRTIKKNLKNRGNIIDSNVKFKFDGKVMKIVRDKEKSTIKPESIIEIIHMNECLCIAVKDDPGIVIPFDAFESKEKMNDLENELRKYMR